MYTASETLQCGCEKMTHFAPNSCHNCRTKMKKPGPPDYACTCNWSETGDDEVGIIVKMSINCPVHGNLVTDE